MRGWKGLIEANDTRKTGGRFIHLAVSALLFVAMVSYSVLAYDDTLPYEAKEPMSRGLAAARQQEWELAIKHFKEARKAAPYSPTTLFNLAMAYDKADKYELVAITWYRAYLAAASSAQDAQTQNRNRLVRERIAALEKKVEATMAKIIQRAQEMVATGLENESYRDSAYQDIAEAQAEAGDIAGAKATVARIAEKQYKNSAYEGIARAQVKIGDKRGALETIATAKESARGTRWNYDGHRAGFYMSIAYVQARTGDIAGAKTTAGQSDYFFKPLAYCYIAKEQIRLGDRSGALTTIALAKESAVGVGKYEPRVYAHIAVAQSKAGDKNGMFKTIELAGKAAAGLGMDEKDERLWAYAAIAEAQSLAGDKNGALKTKKMIESDLDKLWKKDNRSSAYVTIADAQAEAGNKGGALQTIALAREAAAGVENDYSKFLAHRLIDRVHNMLSNVPEAEESDVTNVQTRSGAGIPDRAVKEIDSWAGLFSADPARPVCPDWQTLIASLMTKEPILMVEDLTEVVNNMASALHDIRYNEAKWQKLRAQVASGGKAGAAN
jgi:hypothetical protein